MVATISARQPTKPANPFLRDRLVGRVFVRRPLGVCVALGLVGSLAARAARATLRHAWTSRREAGLRQTAQLKWLTMNTARAMQTSTTKTVSSTASPSFV